METIIKTTQVQLDHFLRERKDVMPSTHFLPTIKVTSYRLNSNSLTFFGVFHRANGFIKEQGESLEIHIKAKVYWFIYVVLFLWTTLSIMYFFSSEFIVNDDLEPTNKIRLLFLSLFNLPVLVIFGVIYYKTKVFLGSIIKEFE